MKRSSKLARNVGLKSTSVLKATKKLVGTKRPIYGTSRRVAEFNAEFEKIRPSILERDGNRCRFFSLEVKTPHDRALHVHHIQPRSRGGTNLPSNLITLCWTHHEYIHGHSIWARKNGWLG